MYNQRKQCYKMGTTASRPSKEIKLFTKTSLIEVWTWVISFTETLMVKQQYII